MPPTVASGSAVVLGALLGPGSGPWGLSGSLRGGPQSVAAVVAGVSWVPVVAGVWLERGSRSMVAVCGFLCDVWAVASLEFPPADVAVPPGARERVPQPALTVQPGGRAVPTELGSACCGGACGAGQGTGPVEWGHGSQTGMGSSSRGSICRSWPKVRDRWDLPDVGFYQLGCELQDAVLCSLGYPTPQWLRSCPLLSARGKGLGSSKGCLLAT